jgi:hypothetical protein
MTRLGGANAPLEVFGKNQRPFRPPDRVEDPVPHKLERVC